MPLSPNLITRVLKMTCGNGLNKAVKAIDTLLNLISSRLGLNHDRVLGSIYAFPVMVRHLLLKGGHLENYKERDKLLLHRCRKINYLKF